jgi:hypothetical protein
VALTGTRHLILLGISLLLVGCAQLPLIERHGAALEVSQDTIQRLTAARSASEELRREVSRSIPHERDPLRTDSGPSSAQLSALREQQHAYLRAREVLFDIALSHASAIVETVDASDLP